MPHSTTTRRRALYSLPAIYDILHTPGTAAEVDALQRMAARGARPRGNPVWLEPACGTGRLLRVAARRGVRVIGFDREPGMIEYARARFSGLGLARRSRLFVAGMSGFAKGLPPRSADFAFNLINTIRHLRTDLALTCHLAGVRRTLRPGGLYAVGISLCAYGLETETEDVWRAARGTTQITQVVQYLPPKRRGRAERVISHITVTTLNAVRHIDSTYSLRAYNTREWRDAIARGGLAVAGVVDDDGRDTAPTEPGYAVWLLTDARPGRTAASPSR